MSNIYKALEQARSEKEKLCLGSNDELGNSPYFETSFSVKSTWYADQKDIIGLCEAIEVKVDAKGKKLITFICSQSGEGVTTLVGEVARASADSLGRSVLILNASKRPAENAECRVLVPGKPLNVASFKTSNPNIGIAYLLDLKDGGSCRDTLDLLRQYYDLILIDLPPLDVDPRSIQLASFADGVILVLEADKTKRPAAVKLKKALVENGGKVLGVVFTKQTIYLPKFINIWL
jgi:protein-tyrosine kinase